jgi:adenylate cyclase
MRHAFDRQSSAVLAADVVGYTRLMEIDENRTHSELMRLRSKVIEPGIAAARGRIVKNTGDGFLAAFDDVIAAAKCAISLQKSIIGSQRRVRRDRRIELRMGLNLCETIVEAEDIYGDGVNIAARLQSYAEPGDVIVSSVVAEQIAKVVNVPIVDLGDLHLKNLTKPVRAFGLLIGSQIRPKPRLDYLNSNRPSIAVLPFRMAPSVPEDSYFADGIVEDIIRALGGLKELLVISRSSTLHYSGLTIDVRNVARELAIRYVLTGSVLRGDGRIRIATELSDAETGIVIRADRYEGGLTDLFDVQDEISRRVIATIAPHVREWELQRSMRKHPENLDAYDLTLQGMDLLYRLDYKSFSRARGLFQQAYGSRSELCTGLRLRGHVAHIPDRPGLVPRPGCRCGGSRSNGSRGYRTRQIRCTGACLSRPCTILVSQAI